MLLALRQRLSYANVMATIGVLVALGGGAYAAAGRGVPDSAGVFHGCVNRRSGTLRVVVSSRSCHRAVRRRGRLIKPGEFAIAWNQRGAPGIQGIQGIEGTPGTNGTPGAPATKLFASVSTGSSGTNVEYASGVTAVSRISAGIYKVTFDRSVANCVVLVEPEFGDPLTHSAGIPLLPSTYVFMNFGGAHHDQVEVHIDQPSGTTGQPNNAPVDSSFAVAALC